jgi:hypothetical protein
MSTMRARLLLAAVLLPGALLPLRVHGQCVVQDGTTAAVSPAMISFGTPTIVDFDNGGIVYASTVRIDVDGRGNRAWGLCIASLAPDLGTAGGVTKPVGDLEWQAPGGSWMPLTLAPQLIFSDRGDRSVVLNVRVRLSWDADVPGTFGTTVQFVVAS